MDKGSPFASHKELYKKIDSIENGDVVWKSATIKHPHAGQNPSDTPAWKLQEYEVWYRDPKAVIQTMLSNPDFKDGFDYAPYMVYDEKDERILGNFMSADWAWNQCVSRVTIGVNALELDVLQNILEKDQDCAGAMFVPIILGTDKTTVSVATGQNEYYPVYISIGNVHNDVRQGHKGAMKLLGFLPTPKGEWKWP